ncbi:hypothetical protein BK742_10710 [Bacillus thuringiensis serovar pingluonsis]|uniref:Transmembrane protein n=1 Tax=Bacillus thuringiensis serovar pingluonsis TaxID=180881 RepID=A0A243BHR8_BACTU|nr:hypothetical protein BK742_10710 [Bacillus thuringiensis serovar pingluonsis]
MLRVKPNNSGGDELPSAGRLNSLVSLIVIFSVRMFVFLFYDIICLDKEVMDCKTTKLDNDSHSAT